MNGNKNPQKYNHHQNLLILMMKLMNFNCLKKIEKNQYQKFNIILFNQLKIN